MPATRSEHEDELVEGAPIRAHAIADASDPASALADGAIEAAAEVDREARTFTRRLFATILTMTVAGGLCVAAGQRYQGTMFAVALLLFGLPVVTAVPLCLLHYRQRHKRRALLDNLCRLAEGEDTGALPSLIGAYHVDTAPVRRLIVDGLIDLLPRVKASDRGLLTAVHQVRLLGILKRRVENPLYKDVLAVFRPARSRPVALRVAILKALEQVGDSSALPVVRSLAEGLGRTEGERAVRDAARKCLPTLQQRSEFEHAQGTLLRPTSPPTDGQEMLLRPAGGAPRSDPDTLLRAADTPPQ